MTDTPRSTEGVLMAQVSRYCKAYLESTLRQFPGWCERSAGPAVDSAPGSTVYFLHENYVVTRGIYVDEDIVFDSVTPEWIQHCVDVLAFRVPDFVLGEPTDGEQTAGSSEAGRVR
jgi:hypothetical protein